jgi:hypothetical protein
MGSTAFSCKKMFGFKPFTFISRSACKTPPIKVPIDMVNLPAPYPGGRGTMKKEKDIIDFIAFHELLY